MTTNSALDALVWDVCETPLGPFTLEASAHGLTAICFPGRGGPRRWDRRDPLPVVVPCHRVIGADGSLTGYRGGLQRKQALLDLERRVTAGLDPEPAW